MLFVLTDDQEPSSLRHMPVLQERLVGGGVTFEEAVMTFPLCCPARATLQTGR